MTLQFGLFGPDGIALVGDMRVYDASGATRTSSKASKFRVNQRRTVATAWARKSTGMYVAKAICDEMPDDSKDPVRDLENIAQPVWDKVSDKDESRLLIALRKPHLQLLSMSLTNAGVVVVHHPTTKLIAGDDQNAATYFVERYYKHRPLKELATIAAHSILLAARLNSATIEDLEILLREVEGIRFLSDHSIAALKETG